MNLDDIANEEKIFKEKSEMGEVFENLDQDIPDTKTGMSTIDFNARLSEIEISSCLKIDELKRLGILPELELTRKKKRLSVSKMGMGREEKVQISGGMKENRSGEGIFNKLSGLFKPRT